MRVIKCDTCGKEIAINGYEVHREAISDRSHSHRGVICKSQERFFTVTLSNRNQVPAEHHFCTEECLLAAVKKWAGLRN